jgi:hypothetical protein
MIAAIESVVTDILNCLGIAETTETVIIDIYINYIEKVLSGDCGHRVRSFRRFTYIFFYFNCYCWSVVAWAQLVW